MEAGARRASGEKLQRAQSTKTTAMSRLFPLRRAPCMRRPSGERAVDGFACARPPNKSVRIGFVRKSVHHSRPPAARGRADGDEARRDKTGRPIPRINSNDPIRATKLTRYPQRPQGDRTLLNQSPRSRGQRVQRQKRPQKEELKWRGRIIEPRQGAAFDSAGRTV